MSDHITRYSLSAADRETKLRQFTNLTDPEDLRGELAAARLMAQEALESGNVGLANTLLATVSKLAVGQVQVKRMKGEFLERAVVLRLAIEIVRILSDSVEGRFPGWENTLADVSERIGEAIAAATNPRLEDKRHA